MSAPAMYMESSTDPDNHNCTLTIGRHVIHTTNKVAHQIMALVIDVHGKGVTEGRCWLAECVLNEIKEYVP